MKMRLVAAGLIGVCAIAAAGLAGADLTRDDMILLGLMYRGRFVAAANAEGADPALKTQAEAVAKIGRGGDPVDRYKAMIKGMAMLNLGGWDEAQEVATALDMRVPAKLYQPGDRIPVQIAPVYEFHEHLSQHYVVYISLTRSNGDGMSKAKPQHFHELQATEIELRIPAGAEPGEYRVEYKLEPHADGAETILSSSRTIFVVEDLEARLAMLAKTKEAYEGKHAHQASKRHALAATTVEWFLSIYERGQNEDVAGAYTGHPMFMHSMMVAVGMAIERMDFPNELAMAEALASDLAKGEDALEGRTGDMRLAYRSPADNELVPFRIFVPEGYDPAKTYPFVIALHGAGGNENAFMDRYQGLYKKNAQDRGYIVASVNGRGPYGGYRGNSGQDVIDVLDVVQATYPIDPKRVYIMGHSMGGGGTVRVGFDNAERFAAMAPIAGFGSVEQLKKAPDMALFIGQGDADALVPVASARAFHEAAQELGMDVKYIELPGVEHGPIVDQVMNDAFDWFDAHSK